MALVFLQHNFSFISGISSANNLHYKGRDEGVSTFITDAEHNLRIHKHDMLLPEELR
jgi:hypothetical protein